MLNNTKRKPEILYENEPFETIPQFPTDQLNGHAKIREKDLPPINHELPLPPAPEMSQTVPIIPKDPPNTLSREQQLLYFGLEPKQHQVQRTIKRQQCQNQTGPTINTQAQTSTKAAHATQEIKDKATITHLDVPSQSPLSAGTLSSSQDCISPSVSDSSFDTNSIHSTSSRSSRPHRRLSLSKPFGAMLRALSGTGTRSLSRVLKYRPPSLSFRDAPDLSDEGEEGLDLTSLPVDLGRMKMVEHRIRNWESLEKHELWNPNGDGKAKMHYDYEEKDKQAMVFEPTILEGKVMSTIPGEGWGEHVQNGVKQIPVVEPLKFGLVSTASTFERRPSVLNDTSKIRRPSVPNDISKIRKPSFPQVDQEIAAIRRPSLPQVDQGIAAIRRPSIPQIDQAIAMRRASIINPEENESATKVDQIDTSLVLDYAGAVKSKNNNRVCVTTPGSPFMSPISPIDTNPHVKPPQMRPVSKMKNNRPTSFILTSLSQNKQHDTASFDSRKSFDNRSLEARSLESKATADSIAVPVPVPVTFPVNNITPPEPELKELKEPEFFWQGDKQLESVAARDIEGDETAVFGDSSDDDTITDTHDDFDRELLITANETWQKTEIETFKTVTIERVVTPPIAGSGAGMNTKSKYKTLSLRRPVSQSNLPPPLLGLSLGNSEIGGQPTKATEAAEEEIDYLSTMKKWALENSTHMHLHTSDAAAVMPEVSLARRKSVGLKRSASYRESHVSIVTSNLESQGEVKEQVEELQIQDHVKTEVESKSKKTDRTNVLLDPDYVKPRVLNNGGPGHPLQRDTGINMSSEYDFAQESFDGSRSDQGLGETTSKKGKAKMKIKKLGKWLGSFVKASNGGVGLKGEWSAFRPSPTPLPSRLDLNQETAIYASSHLKLSRPDRSLAESVLIANFMQFILSVHSGVTMLGRGPQRRRPKRRKQRPGHAIFMVANGEGSDDGSGLAAPSVILRRKVDGGQVGDEEDDVPIGLLQLKRNP